MTLNDTFRYLSAGLPDDILRKKLYGDFDGAIRLIDRRLSDPDLPLPLRCSLTAQREICLRLPGNYPHTRQDALAILRKHIPDFSETEFDEYVDAGKIGWIYIHGQMHFFDRFFQTLCKASPAFALRAGVVLPGAESAGTNSLDSALLNKSMRTMKEKGQSSRRIRIQASLKLKDSVFSKGMSVRAHLPLPAECEQQSQIRIEKVFPENGKISPGHAPQRTICWEETMMENHEFYVEYSYIHTAVYHNTEKPELLPIIKEPSPETFMEFTKEEAPHILFTPYLKNLAGSLTEGISEPLEKARRIYDFITLNMKYTFMPDYFCLENIAESCARNFTGDCGVFALLFLTLCRCAGIPACWQSGLTAEPDFCGAHDWVRFYAAPYGWLYADPSYGIAAVRAQNEERRRFYFGSLDACRMVANNAFQAPFTVDKDFWRADPYDNQVGEIETKQRGLLYEEFERSKVTLLCEELTDKEENR